MITLFYYLLVQSYNMRCEALWWGIDSKLWSSLALKNTLYTCLHNHWVTFAAFLAGVTSEGKEIYLQDIWPSREEVQQTEEDTVIASIFKELSGRMKVRATLIPSFIDYPGFLRFYLLCLFIRRKGTRFGTRLNAQTLCSFHGITSPLISVHRPSLTKWWVHVLEKG